MIRVSNESTSERMRMVTYEVSWVQELRTAFLTERIEGEVIWIRQFKAKKWAELAKVAFDSGRR